MKPLLILCLALAWTALVAGQTVTNQPAVTSTNRPTATATNQLSSAQRQKIVELNKQVKEAFDAKKYADAKQALLELAKLLPDNYAHLYNLACAQSRLGEKKEAIASLEKAVEKGWADFLHLERDEDLDALRKEAGYKALIGRKDQIQRDRAKKINDELTKQLGKGCLHYIDDEHRLVFATNVDQRTLDELRETLEGYANVLNRDLFRHKPERYVTVVVPKTWTGGMIGGLYNDAAAYLTSRGIGDEMIHEFTHALHHGDQHGRGQEHPIWLTEGFGTLYENSDLEDGRAIPRHNHRLNYILSRVRVNRQMPWAKFMAQKQPDFLRWPNYNYAQTRYMMFYLYEQGKLGSWYQNYVTGYASDTNGVTAWERTFGKPLGEVEKDWCEWLQTLTALPIKLKEGDPSVGLTLSVAAEGLTVMGLAPGGGGAKAGLKVKDLVTRVDGQRIASGQDLIEVLTKHKVGDKVKVEYRRGTEYSIVEVELTPTPSPYKKPAPAPPAKPPAKSTAK